MRVQGLPGLLERTGGLCQAATGGSGLAVAVQLVGFAAGAVQPLRGQPLAPLPQQAGPRSQADCCHHGNHHQR